MAQVIASPTRRAASPGTGNISTGDSSQRVTVGGSPGRRFVDILEFDTVTRVRRTYSSATGEFKVHGLDPNKEHCVIGREDRHARVWNDVIRAGIYPVADE